MSSRAYRLRPAPRARTRGRSKSRIHWDKLGRVVLVIVIFAILVSYINPVVNFVGAWSESRSEQATLADLKSENKRLRRQVESLQAPEVAERSARKVGMVTEGESPYVVRGLPRE